MLTISNHDSIVTPEIARAFPKDLKDAHDYFKEFNAIYDADKDIKELIDLYLKTANQFIQQQEKKTPKPGSSTSTAKPKTSPKKKKAPTRKRTAKPKAKAKPKTTTRKAKPKTTAKPKAKTTTRKKAPAKKRRTTKADNSAKVSQLSPEVKVAKRAVRMHDKGIAKGKLSTFIKYMQRLILRKEIRKTSKHAEAIQQLQIMAVNFHNGMHSVETFKLPDELHAKLAAIAGDEKVRTSVNLINRYIGLINSDDRAKLKRLTTSIENAIKAGKVYKSDPYYEHVDRILKKTKSVLENNKTLEATASELSGLQDILKRMGIKPQAAARRKKKSLLAGLLD